MRKTSNLRGTDKSTPKSTENNENNFIMLT